MANPTWTHDELIVTLDFYLRHPVSMPGKTSKEILALSDLLNRLRVKVGTAGEDTFRNANGVYMKLMNFRRFDPDYDGKGLERGGKEDEVIWDRYVTNREELTKVASAIRSFVDSDLPMPVADIVEGEEEDGPEGRILTRTHRYRERDPSLVKRKKDRVLAAHGVIACEVCGFNFGKVYGERGDGFIECHHTKPVSELEPGGRTNLADLALVCSNCHRMIHRRRPWLSVEELSSISSTDKMRLL